jgi:branched-chain amino acid transport system ATP-binding protein
MLEVDKLSVSYGNVRALSGASIKVEQGELVSLIGANGAGKTTLLGAVIGRLKPTSGVVRYRGTVISGQPSHRIVQHGIALVPEGRQLFSDMTVRENLEVGFSANGRGDPRLLRTQLDAMYQYFPVLKGRAEQVAGTLSGGEQQMLAISRALMSSPRLLMLDEPSLGLSPVLVETVAEILTKLHTSGLTILLVEQNAHLGLELASRAYVLEAGTVALEGQASILRGNPMVQQAYLGL